MKRQKTSSGNLELAKLYLKKKKLRYYSDKTKTGYSLKLWGGNSNRTVARLADKTKMFEGNSYRFTPHLTTRYIFNK